MNLLGFLGVYGKPKDTLEAQQDLQHMKQRAALHPEKMDKGRHYLGPACYTLSKEEKQSMFDCLNSINVPSGYSTLRKKEKKFAHVKSHDCHMLMTQLIPVALRGILPANVRATIYKAMRLSTIIRYLYFIVNGLNSQEKVSISTSTE